MTIYRVKKEKCWTRIDNNLINNPNLSAKAKALLIYLLSKPDDWQVYESDIAKHMKDGVKAIRSGLKELAKHGYIKRKRKRYDDGRFCGWEYDVYEKPTLNTSANVIPIEKQYTSMVGSHGISGKQLQATYDLAVQTNRNK